MLAEQAEKYAAEGGEQEKEPLPKNTNEANGDLLLSKKPDVA